MEKLRKSFMSNRSKLQNVAIVILCITVIIEISHLWFVNLANGQSVFQNTNKSVIENGVQTTFLTPERMLKSVDENVFFVAYNGTAYDEVLKIAREIIYNISDDGEFVGIDDYTDEFLKKDGLLIFDYNYVIDGKMLQESLSTEKNTYSKVKDFNNIYFSFEDDIINVFFVDHVQDIYYHFTLKDSSLFKSLVLASSNITSQTTYAYVLDDSSIVNNYELIANIDSNFSYNKLVVSNPFTTEYGDSPRNLVESKVKKYFKNILYMEFSPSDTAYIFSDTDTVVKYFNNGVLEYSYYDVASTSADYSVVEAYSVAKTFLEDDEDIINEYRLKNYYQNNGETVFEFIYVENNYPIIIESEEGLTDIALTVTVKNNIVTNYRKIVHNFSVENDMGSASKSFEDAINIFASPEEGKFIDSVSLGYKASEQSDEMTLYWFMNAFDSKTSLSTY